MSGGMEATHSMEGMDGWMGGLDGRIDKQIGWVGWMDQQMDGMSE